MKAKIKHYYLVDSHFKGLFGIVKVSAGWTQLNPINSWACGEMKINLTNLISQIYLQKCKEVLSCAINTCILCRRVIFDAKRQKCTFF